MAQRWVLVALAALAGLLLVWTLVTWPGASEDAASAASDQAPDSYDYRVPAPEPSVAQPTAAVAVAPEEEPEPQALAPEQAPAPEAAETPEAQADKLFVRENGPLDEYKAKFESEPRDSAANEAEVSIRGEFHPTDGPQPVFRSVLCRETICKIETRISAANLGAYVAAMARLVHDKFDSKLATERTTLVEGDHVTVVVYAKRPSSH
jgi:hypothetical protein